MFKKFRVGKWDGYWVSDPAFDESALLPSIWVEADYDDVKSAQTCADFLNADAADSPYRVYTCAKSFFDEPQTKFYGMNPEGRVA